MFAYYKHINNFVIQTKNNIMNTENLKTISNYARFRGVSTVWVYKLIKAGKLDVFVIDGVKFIKMND